MTDKKAEYAPPGSQVDLQRRLERENKSDRVLSTSDEYEPEEQGEARVYQVEDNDVEQFIGTSPEYATYANDTEAPLKADGDNPEQKVYESFAASSVPAAFKAEGNVEYQGEVQRREEAAKASEEAKASEGSSADSDKTVTAKKAAAPKSDN